MAKILIAEDDAPIARVYEKAFQLSGYEVEIALDGEEALRKLKTTKPKPAAILLDMMMPKLDSAKINSGGRRGKGRRLGGG